MYLEASADVKISTFLEKKWGCGSWNGPLIADIFIFLFHWETLTLLCTIMQLGEFSNVLWDFQNFWLFWKIEEWDCNQACVLIWLVFCKNYYAEDEENDFLTQGKKVGEPYVTTQSITQAPATEASGSCEEVPTNQPPLKKQKSAKFVSIYFYLSNIDTIGFILSLTDHTQAHASAYSTFLGGVWTVEQLLDV